jgi:uncharacterized protein with HEPN domain
MRPEVLKLLTDVRDAVDAIETFTAGKERAELSTDRLLRSAVYFQFAVIGEALAQLRTIEPETAERITEHRRIIAFRNQVIHGYARIDDEITWRIVTDKVPVLRADIQSLLAQ